MPHKHDLVSHMHHNLSWWTGVATSLLLVFATVTFHFIVAQAAATATISVSPASGTYVSGSPVTFDIRLNTGNQAVSGVDISGVATKLTGCTADPTGSVFDTSLVDWTFSATTGAFRFSRLRLDTGYNTPTGGTAGLLLKITCTAGATGTATFSFTQASSEVLAYADGSNILNTVTNGSYTISPASAPEANVRVGTTNIADNNGSRDFGSTPQNTPVSVTFTVENIGNASMTLGPATLTSAADFTITSNIPVTNLAAGATTSFTVQMKAAAVGTPSTQVSFPTSDSDEDPYNFTVNGTVTPPSLPEIQVQDGTTDVPDAGSVQFGSTTVTTPVSKTFTVRNLGSADLNVSNLSVPAGFTVTQTFGLSTIPPGGSTTFTVRLNATTVGTFNGTLTFDNTDANEDPFNFTIAGTVNPQPAPEIQVLDGTTDVTNGATVSYGTTTVGSSVTKTFTVKNLGDATLTLTGSPTVPAGYTLASGFGSPNLAPNASTTFVVRADAGSTGTFTGQVSFQNNDGNENPFSFTVTTVVNPAPAAGIEVTDGGTVILDNVGVVTIGSTSQGVPIAKTLTVRNTGNATLNLGTPTVAAGFSITSGFGSPNLAPGATTTFTVQLNATAVGTPNSSLSFSTNVSGMTTFNFTVQGTVGPALLPEIEVAESGVDIPDNAGSFSFGTTITGTPVTKTFTIHNSGNANLNVGSLTAPSGFTVEQTFGTTNIAAGASTTFAIRLVASTAGNYGGAISFTTNDGDENPFNFSINGVVNPAPAPELQFLDDTSDIANGGTIGFGSTTVGTPITKILTVKNIGTANLTLNAQSVTLPAGFTLTSGFGAASLEPGGSTTLTVRFTAATVGDKSGTLSFGNNDSDENPFSVTLSATATALPAPDIDITDGSTIIQNGGSISFGSVVVGQRLTKTFIITNVGNLTLTLTSVTVPAGFSLESNVGTMTLAPGASTAFTVRVDAAAVGQAGGNIAVVSNDADEGTFAFAISASVTAAPEPKMVMKVGSTEVACGNTYDMGSVELGVNRKKTLSVKSNGTDILVIASAAMEGAGYTITSAIQIDRLPPGSESFMTMQFSPPALGPATGKITVTSNDHSSPCVVNFTGTGLPATLHQAASSSSAQQASSQMSVAPVSSASSSSFSPPPPVPVAVISFAELCNLVSQVEGYHTAAGQRNLEVIIGGRLVPFSDVPANAWYAKYLQPLMQAGILSGYANPDGTLKGLYGGADGLRHAQIAKILTMATSQDPNALTGTPLNPRAVGHWAQRYILAMEQMGLSLFSQDLDIDSFASRGATIADIVSAFHIPPSTIELPYADVEAGNRFAEAIKAATAYGIVSGNPDGTFKPDNVVNRAEMAKMIMVTIGRTCSAQAGGA